MTNRQIKSNLRMPSPFFCLQKNRQGLAVRGLEKSLNDDPAAFAALLQTRLFYSRQPPDLARGAQ
jgi:hypothetical protein